MEDDQRFRTKTGYCHVLPDKILLTRDGIAGNVANVTVGNAVTRILVIYGAFVLLLIWFAFTNYQKDGAGAAVLPLVLALYLVYGIFSSLNNSAAPVIPLSAVKKVQLKRSIPGLTRSRFEVFFEDETGKVKKRLLLLPGTLGGGQQETEKAVRLFRERGLIS